VNGATGDRVLRDAMGAFARPSTATGLALVARDVVAYVAFVAVAVLAEPAGLRLAAGVMAGCAIAALFVLGHDAVHDSLTASPRLNRMLGFLLFAPSLHNPTLWRLVHNRLHHRFPNVRGLDAWSPLSPDEYRALPPLRRALERFHRCGLGFAAYYLVHRWWRHKFYPHGPEVRPLGAAFVRKARRDFALVVLWLALFLAALVALARAAPDPSPAMAVLFGFAIPYVVWNAIVGKTVYLHHTHPDVPWFRDEREAAPGQEHLTVHVVYPRWYGWLSHEIMEHHAHHVHARIPCYRLHAAQARLRELLPDAVVEPLTLRFLADTLRRCKLYDFDRRCWTDFEGRPTGGREARERAAVLPAAEQNRAPSVTGLRSPADFR